MIFSNKIFKITSGKNATLFQKDENTLNLYLFDKTLKKYNILLNNKKNCVFVKEFEYQKIIQLNNETLCICNNNYITTINEKQL